MHVYRVQTEATVPEQAQASGFESTRDKAVTLARTASRAFWPEVFIDLIDIPVDQASVCSYLNGNLPETKPLRSWRLTSRGGIKEEKV